MNEGMGNFSCIELSIDLLLYMHLSGYVRRTSRFLSFLKK